jgi:hypothetical protein
MARPSQDRLQRCLFGLVHAGATFPCQGLDQGSDFLLNARSQATRVHGVQLPTAIAKAVAEPAISRVLFLVGGGERREAGEVLFEQRNSSQLDVIAAVSGDTAREVALRHVETAGVKIADIERDQWPAVVVLSRVVDGGRA